MWQKEISTFDPLQNGVKKVVNGIEEVGEEGGGLPEVTIEALDGTIRTQSQPLSGTYTYLTYRNYHAESEEEESLFEAANAFVILEPGSGEIEPGSNNTFFAGFGISLQGAAIVTGSVDETGTVQSVTIGPID